MTKQANYAEPYEPNLTQALDLVMELMRIAGPSCHEALVADRIHAKLRAVGLPAEWIFTDNAHEQSPAGGDTGNLIVRLPGTIRGPRRLLMAHLDTVPICVGSQPVRIGDYIETANPVAGLGADNRSGVAVLLNTLLEIVERKMPHPPLTFLWTVQEELGLFGSRFVDKRLLGKPRMAWNWDGRGPHRITLAATGGHNLVIKIHGIASHAGGSPERGVSAIGIAGLALHKIFSQGWHGDIQRGKRHGTCNLGIIQGGESTNTVTDFVEIKGECRSYDPRFRQTIIGHLERAFKHAATMLKNDEGQSGRVEFFSEVEYESFRIGENEPCIQAVQAVIRGLGMEPELLTTNSALDANWMNFHGIPTATLGAGQVYGHSVRECMDIEQFETACRVALRLATGMG